MRRVLQPARARGGLDLAQLRGRPVDLDRLARRRARSTSSDGLPVATALPWDMIVTVSARRSASSM